MENRIVVVIGCLAILLSVATANASAVLDQADMEGISGGCPVKWACYKGTTYDYRCYAGLYHCSDEAYNEWKRGGGEGNPPCHDCGHKFGGTFFSNYHKSCFSGTSDPYNWNYCKVNKTESGGCGDYVRDGTCQIVSSGWVCDSISGTPHYLLCGDSNDCTVSNDPIP